MKADSKSNGGACREGRIAGEGGERGKMGEERTRRRERWGAG